MNIKNCLFETEIFCNTVKVSTVIILINVMQFNIYKRDKRGNIDKREKFPCSKLGSCFVKCVKGLRM